MPSTSSTFVALLRGINVGGKNMLPMKDLAAIMTRFGCRDVRTYIQSGNVVFAAPPSLARDLPDLLPARVAAKFGFHPELVIRTHAEVRQVASANPFVKSKADPALLHVGFMADKPDPRLLAALDPHRSPGDSFEVRGREIYLHLPHGVAKSKLTNKYFDSRLSTVVTIRNWRTVLKLVEMAQSEN